MFFVAAVVVVVFAVVIACTLSTTHPARGKCYENGLSPFARVVLYYYGPSHACATSALPLCFSAAFLWQEKPFGSSCWKQ